MNSLFTLLVSLVCVIGLIVLIAMGKITWGDGGPLIAAIVGVHGGAVASTLGNAPNSPAPAPPAPRPPAA